MVILPPVSFFCQCTLSGKWILSIRWPESIKFFKKSVICGEWAGEGSSTRETSPIVTTNIKAITKKSLRLPLEVQLCLPLQWFILFLFYFLKLKYNYIIFKFPFSPSNISYVAHLLVLSQIHSLWPSFSSIIVLFLSSKNTSTICSTYII